MAVSPAAPSEQRGFGHDALAELRRLAVSQDYVVTSRQARELGISNDWVLRQINLGRWRRLHRGVYLTHSGEVSWRARARAAVLHAGPGAALSHLAAAYIHELTRQVPRTIDVTVPHQRQVRPAPGARWHRRRGSFPTTGALPVVARVETVLDLVAASDSQDGVIGWICEAVRRGVHPGAVLDAASRRAKFAQRALLTEMLGHAIEGVESPLELRYVLDVERGHGLPTSTAQQRQRVGGRWIRSDRTYREFRLRVELDGQVAHPGGRTPQDTWRDNTVLLEASDTTLRYGWWHVAPAPCAVAAQVGAGLRAGGWTGAPQPCGPDCALGSGPGR